MMMLNDYYSSATIHADYTDTPTPEEHMARLVQDSQVCSYKIYQ